MSGPDDGRGIARMLRVSTLALCLEAGVALAALMTIGLSQEPDPGEDTAGPATYVLALPFLVVALVLVALAVSAVLVVPVVLLGEDLGRRSAGRPVWWQLLLAVLAGGLLAPLAGGWGWLVGGTALAVAVLLARRARRGHFVSLLLWGTAAVLTAFLTGAATLTLTGH
ncbi:hypothetical protein ABTY59_03290 [Streptomyces sp. NPDC096079]|uniref:hypothetical protein n=1 Tax=unclassified Streptomyces TaxID=2593676 RepID=UPI0033217C70